MSRIYVLLLAVLLLPPVAASAAVTTTVVDIATRGDVTLRFLYVRPDAPVANVVSVPGGAGYFGIQNDGTMTSLSAVCQAFVRNRQALAESGVAFAVVDAASDFQAYNSTDLIAVIRYMQARDNVPTWVTGAFEATNSLVYLARNMPSDLIAGFMFLPPGSGFVVAMVKAINRPTLLMYHVADPFQAANSFYANLTSAPDKELVALSGGSNSGACASAGSGNAFFNGIDFEFSAAALDLINRHAGSLKSVPAATFTPLPGLWWNPNESGTGYNIDVKHGVLAMTVFTYRADGHSEWYLASGPLVNGTTLTATLDKYRSGQCIGCTYVGRPTLAGNDGNVTITFTSEKTATVNLPNGRTTQIEPQAF